MKPYRQLASLGTALCLILCACGQGRVPESSQTADPSLSPSPTSVALQWWEGPDWSSPSRTLEGDGLRAEVYGAHQMRLTLYGPWSQEEGGAESVRCFFQDGSACLLQTLAEDPAGGDEGPVWDGAQDLKVLKQDGGLVLCLRDEEQDFSTLTALAVRGGDKSSYYPVEEGEALEAEDASVPDFSQLSPRFRYLQMDTGEDRAELMLYEEGDFLLTQTWASGEEDLFWGTWDDGNTAITFWPDEQFCGPEAEFRLEKSHGLRIYTGGGPGGLPLEVGAAFQKVGDLLQLDPFDSAVVSQVVDGDRPAIFLNQKEDKALLEEFQEMMQEAVKLPNPQWTEDPEDRPNLQFDLNINGEDVTMVLCPCVVAGTQDKYLLVQKDSYMGRVTYTYYQTRQGDDYDRMCELFQQQYEQEPEVLTAAMAAQVRALTAAISNLDWSDQFPLDEYGVPKEYKAVYRDQRATGYWRAGKAYGAGSRISQAKTGVYYCQAGTVAVRADEIPYGSKLYIRTPGGGFIYGYAVANDTGTGLLDGVIDVDLFYDSYAESVLNSVRWVDIYLLE